MSGIAQGPEMDLVGDSVENATARVKFLRLAFGAASPDQVVSRSEILATLQAIARGGRLSYSWNVPGDPRRIEVRVALLSMMCVETALPVGGDIEISHDGAKWTIYARHDRLNLDPDLWAPLSKNICPEELTAAQVHFGLLPEMSAEAQRTLTLSHGTDWVKITF
ncbi:histidine phosphotransferase family protein [Pseudooctadecabacter sp.]|uniref:histidine phosphotransferase family protein n=1 Tax=Pseudooctadecabacter sp. TaxID=1966338 RepID=UPI0025ED6AC4|nr:histidine phosphotransferase family protein [Pseudooctadecabacter sp.]